MGRWVSVRSRRGRVCSDSPPPPPLLLLLLAGYSLAALEGSVCPGPGAGRGGVAAAAGCLCRRAPDCFSSAQPASLLPTGCCDRGLVCCPATGISEQKCQEYAQLVYAGGPRPQCRMLVLPLIIGGDEAAPGQVPHMALLGYEGAAGDGDGGRTLKWLCGGSLVSERWVLTAAHCLQGYWGPAQWVRVGAWVDGQGVDEGAQELGVRRRVPHPGYRRPARYDDIGLLELDGPVTLGPGVRPACLHTRFDIPTDKAQACGYGRVHFDDDKTGEVLRCVWLPLLPRTKCADYYKEDMGRAPLPRGLPRSLLCAGDLSGGRDTCQGDSGGPLHIMVDKPFCSYSLVGVTAFGKFCGFRASPAVYMRVSQYVSWIESVVWFEDVERVRAGAGDTSEEAADGGSRYDGEWSDDSMADTLYDWVGAFG